MAIVLYDLCARDAERRFSPHCWKAKMALAHKDLEFEKVLKSSRTEIHLEPAGDGTDVTMRAEQKLRGLSRTGGFMMRRASARILTRALEGLDGATGGPPPAEAGP